VSEPLGSSDGLGPGPTAVSGASEPVLRIDDLSVTFVRRDRDLPVVRHASLEIGPGQTYGLVGESGCGKTTTALALMRYLAGNGRIDSGSIVFDGEDMLAMPEDRLRRVRGTKLGMVYQDPATALNPSIRVGDQMAEVIRYHTGISRRDALERAAGARARVAMPDPGGALRRYPFQLSGGQQQRVVIAMALSGDPRLLVLDEPTTGLDATVEAEVLDLIDGLRTRIDAAILLISHNLGMVARMCERVGVMYAGRIVEDGPARDLFTDPRHPYSMGLLRCVPRFGARKDSSTLVPIPGFLPRLGAPLDGCVFAPRCELARAECGEREPDLFPWPGQTPDPATVDLDTLAAGAGCGRHARCYFSELVPTMGQAARRPVTPAAARPAPGADAREPAPGADRLRSATEPAAAVEPPEVSEIREVVRKASEAGASAPRRAGAALGVEHVVKVFKDGSKRVIAVDDVSVEVAAGEILGLVGESGSGKTTLANCVTGLYRADGGDLRFGGAELPDSVARRDPDTLRAIQMVFQNPDATLNPARTAGAILTRAVRRLGGLRGDPARTRVRELASRVRVEAQHLEVRPGELSGGQKQRIAIARAFAGRPALVVCDEPASALDVSVQASILNLLAELQTTEGVSYIFISHDLAVVRYLSDRIAVMYLAKLMELGGADEVFTPPHHPYTEALESAIPTLDFEHPSRRIELRGPVPSLSEPPTGCRFHTRCHRFLGDVCVNVPPPWRQVSAGHRYLCHIEPDELRALQLARLHGATD
jgi:peptide/nickel transport system ATP-binding protein